MDEFPSNSQNRNLRNPQGGKREKPDKVASGRRVKKTGANKIKDVIFGDDSRNVLSYLLNDILIPAAKNMLFDMIRDGAEMRIFGEVRNQRSRWRERGASYVSYDQIGRDRDRRDNRYSQRRTTGKPDDILLDTRDEAEEVLSRMYDLFETYGTVSLADYYDLVGVTSEFTDNKWGWDSLMGSRILRVNNGYIVDLPRMISLN